MGQTGLRVQDRWCGEKSLWLNRLVWFLFDYKTHVIALILLFILDLHSKPWPGKEGNLHLTTSHWTFSAVVSSPNVPRQPPMRR
jgi:hypothetical protein